MKLPTRRTEASGFTLVETLIALGVLSFGVLSLAALLASGLSLMNGSEDTYIAQQKAQETVESIFTARDIQQASWTNINNISQGGIFVDGPTRLCDAGPDGIVGTADDNCVLPDSIIYPGPDGILGTADDVKVVLGNFTRTVVIAPVAGSPGLKSIQVTIQYRAGNFNRSYTLTSYISQFS
jgi:hypothetical protein